MAIFIERAALALFVFLALVGLAAGAIMAVFRQRATICRRMPFVPNSADGMDVDVVYTWVNSSDTAWQERMQQHGGAEKMHFGQHRFPPPGCSACELITSIASVLHFAPWVGNIYIVTDRHQVSLPDLPFPVPPTVERALSSRRIVYVDHADILPPPSCTPVFNSHAIETALHKIPGLSEHFIYMNDDVFVLRPIQPSHFFTVDNKIFSRIDTWATLGVILSMHDIIPSMKLSGAAYANLRKHLGRVFVPAHTPHALSKTLMQECEEMWPSLWRKTACSKFRHEEDIPPVAMSLAWGAAQGRVVRAFYVQR